MFFGSIFSRVVVLITFSGAGFKILGCNIYNHGQIFEKALVFM